MSTIVRLMERPAAVVHRFMKDQQRVCVWLIHDTQIKMEGNLLGYDEFMNIVLGDTTEVNLKTKERVKLGKILLRSDNVGLIHPIGV